MFKVGVTNIEDVSQTLMKRIDNFQYIYISYNLLLERFRIIVIVEITREDVFQYYAPYPFYLILLNLVELV